MSTTRPDRPTLRRHRPTLRPDRPTRRHLVVAALAVTVTLAACSSDASTRSGDAAPADTTSASASTPATAPVDATTAPLPDAVPGTDVPAATVEVTTAEAAPVSVPPVPEGVTLRLGDQFDYLQTILSLAGEDQDFPYEVQYSSFLGGPPMLQAFQAGELDGGFIGTTPLIFAAAAGLDLVGIASWAPNDASAYTLVTAPGVTDIAGWEDLAGRTVAFQKGTTSEAVLLQGLDEAGIDFGDLNIVDVPSINIAATLEGGSADVGVLVEPLTSAYVANNPTATVVEQTDSIVDRSSILISTGSALDDPGKEAALADYLARLVRAFAFTQANPEQGAIQVYVDTYGLTPERAAELVDQSGGTQFQEIPGELGGPQQRVADLFAASGAIPDTVDVLASFDTRFNELVLSIQQEATQP